MCRSEREELTFRTDNISPNGVECHVMMFNGVDICDINNSPLNTSHWMFTYKPLGVCEMANIVNGIYPDFETAKAAAIEVFNASDYLGVSKTFLW